MNESIPIYENIPELRSIKILDDRTTEISYNDDALITLKVVEEVFRLLSEMTENKRVARLVIIGKDNVVTNAARLAMAEENKRNKHLIIAEAFVVHSFYQKVRINFYMNLIKRKYPVQCFTNQKSANEWVALLVKKDKRSAEKKDVLIKMKQDLIAEFPDQEGSGQS